MTFQIQYDYEHLNDTTGSVWRHVIFFPVLLCLKNESQVTSIVEHLAATQFTPETPKVFCGLTSPTPPSA